MASANYIFIIFLSGMFCIAAKFTRKKKVLHLYNNVYATRFNWLLCLLLIIPIIFIITYRDIGFADTSAYMNTFNNMPDNIDNLSNYMTLITKDELYYFVASIIRIYISKNYLVYFFIIASFQMLSLTSIFRKYSEDFFFSIFLFIASTDYLSWTFNGIRQFTAVCITFLAFRLILTKKYLFAIIVILFASFFHGSALIFLPFIFICQGKAWNKKTLLFLFGVIIIVSFVDQFTDILDNALSDTQYKNVVSDWTSSKDDGTHILRVLVYSVPAIISLYGKKTIQLHNDPLINICTNMSIASAGIYVVSMFTSGIFVGRLPIYFSLYSYILLPWEFENLFSRDSKKIVKISAILFYFIFYFYSIKDLI